MVLKYKQESYEPSFTRILKYWAIDKNGMAYYYDESPYINNNRSNCWASSSCYYIFDVEFDKEKYSDMWMNDAWKNSLMEKNNA